MSVFQLASGEVNTARFLQEVANRGLNEVKIEKLEAIKATQKSTQLKATTPFLAGP